MNSCARHPDVNEVVDIDPTKPLVKIKPRGRDDEEIDDGDDESSEKRHKKHKINATKTQQRLCPLQVSGFLFSLTKVVCFHSQGASCIGLGIHFLI